MLLTSLSRWQGFVEAKTRVQNRGGSHWSYTLQLPLVSSHQSSVTKKTEMEWNTTSKGWHTTYWMTWMHSEH